MPRFEKHIFICTNERSPDDPKGCCAAKNAREIAARFKEELHKRGLKGKMRANKAGCLDLCEWGPTVVIYPEGVWYKQVTPDDVPEIIEAHLIGNRPVERIRATDEDWAQLSTARKGK